MIRKMVAATMAMNAVPEQTDMANTKRKRVSAGFRNERRSRCAKFVTIWPVTNPANSESGCFCRGRELKAEAGLTISRTSAEGKHIAGIN
jgi:hypothetical protein